LLFSAGVLGGRIDINSFVALTSTNVAKIYGLYPRKGTIAVGADADLVVWNDQVKLRVENALLHHNVDYTPYEGIELSAWPEITISRGEVVWSRPNASAAKGRGRFLRCERPGPARRRASARPSWLIA